MKEGHRSNRRNFCSCRKKAGKKFKLARDSNPWPLRYRCSALPIGLLAQLAELHREGAWLWDPAILCLYQTQFKCLLLTRSKKKNILALSPNVIIPRINSSYPGPNAWKPSHSRRKLAVSPGIGSRPHFKLGKRSPLEWGKHYISRPYNKFAVWYD